MASFCADLESKRVRVKLTNLKTPKTYLVAFFIDPLEAARAIRIAPFAQVKCLA